MPFRLVRLGVGWSSSGPPIVKAAADRLRHAGLGHPVVRSHRPGNPPRSGCGTPGDHPGLRKRKRNGSGERWQTTARGPDDRAPGAEPPSRTTSPRPALPPSESFRHEACRADPGIYERPRPTGPGSGRAGGSLDWFRAWDTVLQWTSPSPGGSTGHLNVSYNCLDRHVAAAGGTVAFPGRASRRTRHHLRPAARRGSRFANVPAGARRRRGDRWPLHAMIPS